MKEATGELNMTVVTVVAIAAVAAFFYAFVWPQIRTTINRNTNCANAYGCTCTKENGTICDCFYDDAQSGETRQPIECDNTSSGTTGN